MSPSKQNSNHVPVLLEETMEALAVQPGGRYVDCTVGSGGHARAILERSSPGGQLLGIDADPTAIKAAQKKLEAYRSSVLLVNDNFVNLQATCIKYDFFFNLIFVRSIASESCLSGSYPCIALYGSFP